MKKQNAKAQWRKDAKIDTAPLRPCVLRFSIGETVAKQQASALQKFLLEPSPEMMIENSISIIMRTDVRVLLGLLGARSSPADYVRTILCGAFRW
jgi:hypothetical protein